MVAILFMAIGSMLYVTNATTRSSRDKILYEQAYQAAIAGTQVARAWLIDTSKAGTMTNDSTVSTSLDSLRSAFVTLNQEIVDTSYTAAAKTPSQIVSYLGTKGFTAAGTGISNGRKLLYKFPTKSGRVVAFPAAPAKTQFTDNLFHGNVTNGLSNYVSELDLTTIGTSGTVDYGSLREVSMIIESHGKATLGGVTKERVIHERVLIYPQKKGPPLISSNAAIMSRYNIYVNGSKGKTNSHFNVHWAPVMAAGNIEMLELTLTKGSKNGKPSYELGANNQGSKANAAGLQGHDNQVDPLPTDKWLKWQAAGDLLDSGDNNFFAPLYDGNSTLASSNVGDFFQQVLAGTFTASIGLSPSTLQLGSDFDPAINGANWLNTTSKTPYTGGAGSDFGLYGLAAGNTYTSGSGSLMQHSQAVADAVNAFFSQLQYDTLKAYAIDHNGYIRPNSATNPTAFYGPNGSLLYVDNTTHHLTYSSSNSTKLTGLGQLDMTKLIPSSMSEPYDTSDPSFPVADQILFVDNFDNAYSSDPNKASPNYQLDSFFWKGVSYICGDVDFGNSGGVSLKIKSPDQFNGLVSGYETMDKCHLDGIMICNGNVSGNGGYSIYGSLAGRDGVTFNGNTRYFYNTQNSLGRLQTGSQSLKDFRLVSGRIYETE